MPNDTERLNWLEQQFGCGLISDDNDHWAFSGSGVQNVPSGDEPEDIYTSFMVEATEWHNSIREAIDAAMADEAQAGATQEEHADGS